MSSLTIDEKMHLIEKMRNNSSTAVPERPFRSCDADSAEPDLSSDGFQSLKYRIFVCLFVFSAFFSLYKMNFSIKGHKITEINVLLEEDLLPEKLQSSLECFSNEILEKTSSNPAD